MAPVARYIADYMHLASEELRIDVGENRVLGGMLRNKLVGDELLVTLPITNIDDPQVLEGLGLY